MRSTAIAVAPPTVSAAVALAAAGAIVFAVVVRQRKREGATQAKAEQKHKVRNGLWPVGSEVPKVGEGRNHGSLASMPRPADLDPAAAIATTARDVSSTHCSPSASNGGHLPVAISPQSPAMPVASTPSGKESWPAVVHVLHDEGLAADVADWLERSETRPRGVSLRTGKISDFRKVSWTGGPRHVVVFVVATLENEQPSEEAGPCCRFFQRKSHPPGMLAGKMAFAVLGLGDSNLLLDRQTTTAKDCNQVARKLDRRLEELGAKRICGRGEADDRTGNAEIEPWLRKLEAALAETCLPSSPGTVGCDCGCNLATRPRIRRRSTLSVQ